MRNRKFFSKHASKPLKLKAILFINDVSTQSCPVKIYFLLKKRNTLKGDTNNLSVASWFPTAERKSIAVIMGKGVTGKCGKLEKAQVWGPKEGRCELSHHRGEKGEIWGNEMCACGTYICRGTTEQNPGLNPSTWFKKKIRPKIRNVKLKSTSLVM